MENSNKSKLIEEQLRKFKHRVDYKINESAKYRPYDSTNEEFDEVPQLTNEAGEEIPPVPGSGTPPPEPTNDQPVGLQAPGAPPAPAPEGNPPAGEVPPPAPADAPPAEGPADDGMGGDINSVDGVTGNDMGGVNPQAGAEVDDIQNEIIKHNIEAMKSIHDQLEGLNSTVQGLNSKFEALNADVEEVREPTNTEKLMSKKNVSYPYYFNLNDFWSGNWFNEKRGQENEKGVRELPDGTFIADFDDLPQQSKIDVQNSFNDFN